MRLSNRSFPHPVVGNADDVPGAEFQATFDFESDKTTFYLKATVRCSSKTLQKMIAKGTACYTLHVECSNTLFRRTYDFTDAEFRVSIPATLIHDAVEVNAFVRAKVAVPKYAVDGAHADYDDATFGVDPGDVLAVGDGQTFDADHTVDPLRRVGALMVVDESTKPGDHAMEAEFGDDKIRIVLCKEDFKAYREMKTVPKLTDHLTTTLVLPVLMQAIHHMDDADGTSESKWARSLRQLLDAKGFGPATDTLEKAQQLLSLPIRRALVAAQALLPVTGP